jgi:hypothetical protein
MSIIVLPPPEPAARLQLERIGDLARDCGFSVCWQEIRGSRGAQLRAVGDLHGRIRRAPVLVLGDPFSRFLQVIISTTRPRQVVVVDDGSASIEFADIVEGDRPLVRWHRGGRQSRPDRLIAARARHRLLARTAARSDEARLELFTAMPVRSARVRVVRNNLGWTRSRFAAPTVTAGVDLVGSSLVESGVVDEQHYLRAVATLTAGRGPVRYLAHRRESNDKLARINALGLAVIRPDLPLELFARIGPVAEQVISFPSTVVHTLPLALSDTRVEVLVCDIERQWYSPGHQLGRSGTFLTSVTETARRTYGLNAVLAV